MKKKLTLLMAAAECRGVAKVGGLADVVFDLSRGLLAAGHRVHVVLPLYADLPLPATAGCQPVLDYLVRFEGEGVSTRLHRATVNGLVVHLIEAPLFQGEEGSVYVDSGRRGKGPFEDDARRFAFFSAAVWELVKHHAPFQTTDVLHCHDWHTGLIPLLARLDAVDQFRTVFTIHNLDYQGTRPLDDDYAPGASWRQWFPERWEALVQSALLEKVCDPVATHCFNPLRCGIQLCDAVNTVSPTYAREITQSDDEAANFFGGRGLEADLRRRQHEGRLWGILNGLDYDAFDPSRLSPSFDATSPDLIVLRRAHRDALWNNLTQVVSAMKVRHGKRFGNADRVEKHLEVFLKTARPLPLTVCVTRAVRQKLGLFTEDLEPGLAVAQAFLQQGTALLVIGTGELEEQLEPLNDDPAALFLQVFDGDFATRLYAAGDLFLMPSDFEPCGISQLMALRFGCLPLVHDRGGLHDTVHDGRTGFVYQGSDRAKAKEAFLKTTARAVATFTNGTQEPLIREAMAQRFEWPASVSQYETVYRTILHP